MVNSWQKGKRGELEAAKLLRSYGFTARRGRQYSGGPESPDLVVEELPHIHFEVKFGQPSPDWKVWMAQALADAGPTLEPRSTAIVSIDTVPQDLGEPRYGKRIPIVLYKPARRPWLAALMVMTGLTDRHLVIEVVSPSHMLRNLQIALLGSDVVEIDNNNGIAIIQASALLEKLKSDRSEP